MKKVSSILCTLFCILSLTACSKSTAVDYSNQTIVGKVTEIDNNTVTVIIGTLNQIETEERNPSDMKQGDGQMPPEMPQDAQSGATSERQQEERQSPPDMPQQRPDAQSGATSENNQQENQISVENVDTKTEATQEQPNSGKMPPDGQNSFDKPSGQMPPDGQGSFDKPDEQMPMGTMYTFTSTDETASFDLDKATIKVESGMDTKEGSITDISVDSVLSIEVGDKNVVNTITVKMVASPSSNAISQGSSANTIDKDSTISDASYTSSNDDENALRINGATVTLNDITVDKSGGASSNTENGDFYGVNAALLATNGASVTIKNATVTSNAKNGNGIFSYGTNTVVNVSDSKITTKSDNSGGIQTTGGGTTNAENLTIETDGDSSAAIRSDRGGGTVNVKGGTYTSNGYNSPAIYSTANITVSNATLTANNSEALVIEGKNSISLNNCLVSGNMSDTKGTSSDENVHAIMIYQSMSGDADVGTSSFTMQDGELIINNGDVFHFTNTDATVSLTNVKITNHEADGYLFNITGNNASHGWGNAGSNGANVSLVAQNQKLTGDTIVDTISTLNLTLSEKSTLTGTINIVDNIENGKAVDNNVVVTIEKGCTWKLTGNCKISSLDNKGTIDFNGYTITLANGSVLQ